MNATVQKETPLQHRASVFRRDGDYGLRLLRVSAIVCTLPIDPKEQVAYLECVPKSDSSGPTKFTLKPIGGACTFPYKMRWITVRNRVGAFWFDSKESRRLRDVRIYIDEQKLTLFKTLAEEIVGSKRDLVREAREEFNELAQLIVPRAPLHVNSRLLRIIEDDDRITGFVADKHGVPSVRTFGLYVTLLDEKTSLMLEQATTLAALDAPSLSKLSKTNRFLLRVRLSALKDVITSQDSPAHRNIQIDVREPVKWVIRALERTSTEAAPSALSPQPF